MENSPKTKKTPAFLYYLLPSLGAMLWVAAFIGVLTKGSQMVNADGDLALHIAVGEYILENRTVPLFDVFSHTMPGEPYTPHEWLAEVLVALAHRLMGLDGTILLAGLVIATAFWLVHKRNQLVSNSFIPLLLVGSLSLLASANHWLDRPHIFTFLFLALWLAVLEAMRRGRVKLAWLLPLLMLPWVNLHGGYMTGLITWALYGFGLAWDGLLFKSDEWVGLPGKFWRYYLAGGAAALLATLLNPSGIGLWKTNLGFLASDFMVNHLDEYRSPDFHDFTYWPFLIFIILLLLGLGLSKKKARAEWLFPSLAWMAVALFSTRNIPLFVIVAAPFLTLVLRDLFTQYSSAKLLRWYPRFDGNLSQMDAAMKGFFWPVLVVLIALIGLRAGVKFDKQQIGNNFDPQKFPVEAVNWLDENPQSGEMFNYYIWGGYLLYRDQAAYKVFIDGKIDFYGEAHARDYLRVIFTEPGWDAVLDVHGVDWALLPVEEKAAQSLAANSAWTVVYQDDTALIVHRK
jgi:hypothetical protein